MTLTTRDLLDAYDRLSEVERRTFATEIPRRTCDEDLEPIEDEDFVSAAEVLFLELDAREVFDARP